MRKNNSNSVTGSVVAVLILLLCMSIALIANLLTRPAGALNVPKGYRTVNITLRDYAIEGPPSLPRGNYEFVAVNHGTGPHELVMWSTRDKAAALPLRKSGDVNEESSALESTVDSGSALAPGETRILYADLTTAGHYALVCNLPAHYRLGMHLDLAVS
jgi:hypothetical protein